PSSNTNNTGWTNPNNAYASDGVFATAAPPLAGATNSYFPTASANNVGPWANPNNLNAADGVYATAAPALPSSITTSAQYPTGLGAGSACLVGGVNTPSCEWQSLNNVNAAEATPAYATADVPANGVASVFVGGFNFGAIPSNAVITGMTINIRWKS